MAVNAPDSIWAGSIKGGGLAAWLARIVQTERERLVVWSPVLLVAGIFVYFALPWEPSLAVGILGCSCAALVILRRPRHTLLMVMALVVLGFSLTIIRAQWVGTPLLRAKAQDIRLTGQVYDIERQSRRRGILVLQIMSAPDLPIDERPRRVRLQVPLAEDAMARLGDTVELRAHLSPLPRPVSPGGFDYGRQLYFQGIGAIGWATEPPMVLSDTASWRFTLRRIFHDLRAAIGQRIRASISGPLGAIAEALITGERAAIPRRMNESLQASGLFHVLSISGLHMSMVAGGAFWVVRAALAFSPALALNHPIKKWAAAAAILVGLFYLLLADSGPATDRAFIMIAIVFFAVMVDRPAISLHNLAVAAVITLLLAPEQATNASFQMSFIAVMGLAALFPLLARLYQDMRGQVRHGLAMRWLRQILFWLLATAAASLVAGTLSGIPAAHHFGRLAPYGVVANALALPIVGLVVMPAAMVSVLLMPLGLEALPLLVMEQGLSLVLRVSDWVAAWPFAAGRWPLLPAPAAVLLALAAALLCLPASDLRLLALPMAVAALLFVRQAQPLLLIDDRAANIALATTEGWVPAVAQGASFSVGKWLEQNGDEVTVQQAAKRPGWSCSDLLCLADVRGYTLAYLRRAAEAQMACPSADLLVAEFPLRKRCKGRLASIDRFSVWRDGSHALFIQDGKIIVQTARGLQGNRPWVYASRARSPISDRSP